MKGKLGSLILAIIGTSDYDICHNIAKGTFSPFLGAAVVGATEIFLSSVAFIICYFLKTSRGSLSLYASGNRGLYWNWNIRLVN